MYGAMSGAWFLDGPLEDRELVIDSPDHELHFHSLHPDELRAARERYIDEVESPRPLRTITHVYTQAGPAWWRGEDGVRWFLYTYSGVAA